MCLDIAVEIVADEVEIAVIEYRATKGGEATCVAEHVGFDGVEHFHEIGIRSEVAIVVSMTEIFDVFGEVAKEEDVLFADFSSDFDLENN